ncbi:hypothetical protein HLH33_18740 [Gluconacetobacter diazotrophicus]|uniref:Transmembrane protein n=1 Tax=Gluconacetobacter diazotrophicus TaxID=33996 RepID=A0A7W4I8P6_GLUDI|nr:hypothetical protein [Gluconacetobacter diazotrophicus]MBB2158303.1 hypothetical protein [Gluconacetobacter diazotrophicus]
MLNIQSGWRPGIVGLASLAFAACLWLHSFQRMTAFGPFAQTLALMCGVIALQNDGPMSAWVVGLGGRQVRLVAWTGVHLVTACILYFALATLSRTLA